MKPITEDMVLSWHEHWYDNPLNPPLTPKETK